MNPKCPSLLPALLLLAFIYGSAFAAPKVEVTGILISSTGSKAIINGKCYAVNDTVGGGTITSIEKGCVTVQTSDKTWNFPVSGRGQIQSGKPKSFADFMKRGKERIADLKSRTSQKLPRK